MSQHYSSSIVIWHKGFSPSLLLLSTVIIHNGAPEFSFWGGNLSGCQLRIMRWFKSKLNVIATQDVSKSCTQWFLTRIVLRNKDVYVSSFSHTVCWKGKCSHGGAVDQTSTIAPKGGINKDTFDSSHGFLHTDAANLAIVATSELLEDIQRAAGDRPFLEYGTHSAGFSYVL